jgi:hypothetical protein
MFRLLHFAFAFRQFLHGSVLMQCILLHSTQTKPGPLLQQPPPLHLERRHQLQPRRWRRSSSSVSLTTLTILVIFSILHSVAFVDLSSCVDSNNIADFRVLRLFRLLFGRFGFGETVASRFVERFHLPSSCNVLVEILVHEVLAALESLAVEVFNLPLGVGVSRQVERTKGDKSVSK